MEKITRRGFIELGVRYGVLTAGTIILGDLSVSRLFAPPVVRAGTVIPPTLESINEALVNADRYLSGLYKVIDSTRSTVAEYYACPIVVENISSEKRLLPGEQTANVRITDVSTDKTAESFHMNFPTPNGENSPGLRVVMDWNNNKHINVTVTNEQFTDRHASARVCLLDRPLAEFSQGNIGQSQTITLDKADYHLLQSLRYTFRHGSQAEMNRRLKVNNDTITATKLRAFLEESGFAPDFDMHAPMWRSGTEYPDRMLLTPDGDDRYQTFDDCKVRIPPTATGYMYQSKVCISPDLYTEISKYDTLLPIAESLHLLNKHGDPTYRASDMATPLDVATDIARKYDQSPIGVGMATPMGYNADIVSGIRTAEFCALATDLAYKYQLLQFKDYADATINILLGMQVGPDGWIKTTTGDYYRPPQAGGFSVAWDRSFRTDLEQPIYYQFVNNFNMQPEYRGIVATNTETTEDAVAALWRYRSLVYGV